MGHQVGQAFNSRQEGYRGEVSSQKSPSGVVRQGIRCYLKEEKSRYKERQAALQAAQKDSQEDSKAQEIACGNC